MGREQNSEPATFLPEIPPSFLPIFLPKIRKRKRGGRRGITATLCKSVAGPSSPLPFSSHTNPCIFISQS